MVVVLVTMKYFHVFFIFVLLNVSLINGDPSPPEPDKKDDCSYCVREEKKDEIKNVTDEMDKLCDCFNGNDSAVCSDIKPLVNFSATYDLIEKFCDKAVKPLKDILKTSTCEIANNSLSSHMADDAGSYGGAGPGPAPLKDDKNNTIDSNPVEPDNVDKKNASDIVLGKDGNIKNESNPESGPSKVSVAKHGTSDPSSLVNGSNSSHVPKDDLQPPPKDIKNETHFINTKKESSPDAGPSKAGDKDSASDPLKPVNEKNSSVIITPDLPPGNTTANNASNPSNSSDGDGMTSKGTKNVDPAPVDVPDNTNNTEHGGPADRLSADKSESASKTYGLGSILTSIFLSFAAGILVAVLVKLFYNRYRKASYALPPDQGMQDMS